MRKKASLSYIKALSRDWSSGSEVRLEDLCREDRSCAFETFFGLVNVGRRELKGSALLGRDWQVSGASIPTIHGTSFLGLNMTLSGYLIKHRAMET
jgi:hypothetical protein